MEDVVEVAVRIPENTEEPGGDKDKTHTVGYLVGGHSRSTSNSDKSHSVKRNTDVNSSVGVPFTSG